MDENPDSAFDLDRAVQARLDNGDDQDGSTHLQALAVLIDADLTDDQRAQAFQAVMTSLLAQLDPDELGQFQRVAAEQGEAAAMAYLAQLSAPRPSTK